MLGASAVWVGTRFILADEAGAPKAHQEAVRTAGFDDNVRTIIFTGRPLRVRNNAYIRNWEENRQAEIKTLTEKGVIPVSLELTWDPLPGMTDHVVPYRLSTTLRRKAMGKAAAVVNEKKSARDIVDEFVNDAVQALQVGNSLLVSKSKL
jgi:NAD(P)H-dependent flavin oxidoreductase YrpB (nitropropane dioxygenase family)